MEFGRWKNFGPNGLGADGALGVHRIAERRGVQQCDQRRDAGWKARRVAAKAPADGLMMCGQKGVTGLNCGEVDGD